MCPFESYRVSILSCPVRLTEQPSDFLYKWKFFKMEYRKQQNGRGDSTPRAWTERGIRFTNNSKVSFGGTNIAGSGEKGDGILEKCEGQSFKKIHNNLKHGFTQ